MNFKAAIFDLDGTLLDSMKIWTNLAREFLLLHNIDTEIDLDSKLGVVSIRHALEYMINEYALDISLDDAYVATRSIVEDFYRNKAILKPGAEAILDYLKNNNIPCGMITATEKNLITPVLERLGIEHYFKEIFCCPEMQTSKRTPDIFFQMSVILTAPPQETIVFEDALYAAETAKNAGFSVAAVFDSSEKEQEKLQKTADIYFHCWEDFPFEKL